jgi:threonine dehydrogenase-like Zn-dependent dehydrogenase
MFGYAYVPLSRPPGLWGAYADTMYLDPFSIVHPIKKDLPPEIAVMFNPLGAGFRWAVELPDTGPGDTVLILGPGQRGLASVIAARAAGADAIVVTGLTRDAKKLALAKELGADHTIDVEQDNTVERVQEITGGIGADVVLDVTPMATRPVLDAIECVRHGGRIVLAGLKGRKATQLSTDAIIHKAATVVGAYGVDARAYIDAIRIIESGRFPLEKMHTHTFGLADAARAVETLAGEVSGEEAVHVTIAP